MRKFVVAFLLTFFIALIVGVGFQSWKFGVVIYKIPGKCAIDVYSKPLQPLTTIVILCPGLDGIYIWPLPDLQPWFEDWWEIDPGLIQI